MLTKHLIVLSRLNLFTRHMTNSRLLAAKRTKLLNDSFVPLSLRLFRRKMTKMYTLFSASLVL